MNNGMVVAENYAKAIFNILDDVGEERARLNETQRAVLNILEDFSGERAWLEASQRASLNILEDSADEKARLSDAQRAVINILEDFEIEKTKVENTNIALRNEIADRLRAEEDLRRAKIAAEEASSELEAFSYSVAHDLRAPLRSVDGFSQAILEDCADRLDAEGKSYLQNIGDAARQMGRLIDGLLNLSRMARSELRRERVDLSGLAGAVLARLRNSQPDREVETVVEPDLVADADPRLMDVVLTNLLGNAWKFTGRRERSRIEFATRSGEIPRVYFIRDDGVGFDEAYVDKLFGVFQRLHTTQEFEGTGIGLATVQRIVRRHGGRIWAKSEVDRGATFYFTLEKEFHA